MNKPKLKADIVPEVATLFLRGIDPAVARKIKRGAGARGITMGEYLALLVGLHELAIVRGRRTMPENTALGGIYKLLIDARLEAISV